MGDKAPNNQSINQSIGRSERERAHATSIVLDGSQQLKPISIQRTPLLDPAIIIIIVSYHIISSRFDKELRVGTTYASIKAVAACAQSLIWSEASSWAHIQRERAAF